jgi:VWFA-related protein
MTVRVAAALVMALAAIDAPAPAPQFRSGIEVVSVDVLVKRGNRPVRGLTADNFELFDNSVPQRIQSVQTDAVPLNVMLVLDVSESTKGRPLRDLKEAAHAVVASLRADDRMALLTFSQHAQLRSPWTQDAVMLRAAIDRTVAEGGTALRDAAFSAISLRERVSGRMLMILFSDGNDTASWLTAGDLLAAAERTDVAINVIQTTAVPPRISNEHRRMVDANPRLHEMLLLPMLASDTGGAAIAVTDSSNVRSAFLTIIDDFRSGYVLTYTPAGVEKQGWHSIDVRLKGARGDVRAKRGYSKP